MLQDDSNISENLVIDKLLMLESMDVSNIEDGAITRT